MSQGWGWARFARGAVRAAVWPLRQEPKIHGDRERERVFLEAIDWMDRSGAQWRLLPARCLEQLYKRSRAGTSWGSGSGCPRRWRTTPPAERDDRRDGGAGRGPGEGIRQRKARALARRLQQIHVLVDALANPLFIRTGGAAGDNPQAIPLLAEPNPEVGHQAHAPHHPSRTSCDPTTRKRAPNPRDCDYAAYKDATWSNVHRQAQVLPACLRASTSTPNALASSTRQHDEDAAK